jgi:hypothetical protein
MVFGKYNLGGGTRLPLRGNPPFLEAVTKEKAGLFREQAGPRKADPLGDELTIPPY